MIFCIFIIIINRLVLHCPWVGEGREATALLSVSRSLSKFCLRPKTAVQLSCCAALEIIQSSGVVQTKSSRSWAVKLCSRHDANFSVTVRCTLSKLCLPLKNRCAVRYLCRNSTTFQNRRNSASLRSDWRMVWSFATGMNRNFSSLQLHKPNAVGKLWISWSK